MATSSRAHAIVELFADWLDGFADLPPWDQERLITEVEWFSLETRVAMILGGVTKDGDA